MEGLAFQDVFFGQYTAIHPELSVVLKNAANGFAKAETTQLITICRGPVGNIYVANTLDGMLKLDEDARRHLHICNNNNAVPFAESVFLYGGTAGGGDDGVYVQRGT